MVFAAAGVHSDCPNRRPRVKALGEDGEAALRQSPRKVPCFRSRIRVRTGGSYPLKRGTDGADLVVKPFQTRTQLLNMILKPRKSAYRRKPLHTGLKSLLGRRYAVDLVRNSLEKKRLPPKDVSGRRLKICDLKGVPGQCAADNPHQHSANAGSESRGAWRYFGEHPCTPGERL